MFSLDAVGHFFLAAAVVLAVSRGAGALVARVGQPRVMGEVLAGIALGPSLLGAVSPRSAALLFPPEVLPMLFGLAQLGLALFMFAAGQELSAARLRGSGRQALAISQASLLVPFAAGVLVALPLYGAYAPDGVSRAAFALFLGCALSITAFPVLARVLEDLGLTRTRPGRLSLYAAAVGDAGSWLALAAILAFSQGSGLGQALARTLAAVTVVAVFLGPVRRLAAGPLTRWTERAEPGAAGTALVVAIGCSAALTAAVGMHQLIGAFLVGLVWPPGRGPGAHAATALTSTARTVLLPFFFLGFGLGVDLGALRPTGGTCAVLGLLLAAAVLTKTGGPALAARLTGLPRRESWAVGILLNTRGLTELVVLEIGHEAGLIDSTLLALLTAVALLTTAMTAPLLARTGTRPDPAPAPRGARGTARARPGTRR
ncbi:hypothetical protein Stsp02_48220 [Streptomyces sp. NBRC 14336]|uniref:cation:proton antiporter n=1 Tax=Streptomyces sp. NBRC 14336 TaxID=3030992 RepID=UPI0024A137B8|nr:cation:proton antiporter [Streptomyces sp. NBRC 14336]GLW49161.1 hypothetical protein Stsp02_48220 [Streptomyces sp. NBRC 14336]